MQISDYRNTTHSFNILRYSWSFGRACVVTNAATATLTFSRGHVLWILPRNSCHIIIREYEIWDLNALTCKKLVKLSLRWPATFEPYSDCRPIYPAQNSISTEPKLVALYFLKWTTFPGKFPLDPKPKFSESFRHPCNKHTCFGRPWIRTHGPKLHLGTTRLESIFTRLQGCRRFAKHLEMKTIKRGYS